ERACPGTPCSHQGLENVSIRCVPGVLPGILRKVAAVSNQDEIEARHYEQHLLLRSRSGEGVAGHCRPDDVEIGIPAESRAGAECILGWPRRERHAGII